MAWIVHEFQIGLGLMLLAMVLGSFGALSRAKRG